MRKQTIKTGLSKSLGLMAMFILMLSVFSSTANAEWGDVVWSNVLHYNDFETPLGDTINFHCRAIAETDDNGCIVAAYAESRTFCKPYLIKMGAGGDIAWVRHYDWDVYSYYPHAILAESDGGYIVAGSKTHFAYEIPPSIFKTGAFLFKVDSDGDTVWTNYYNDGPGVYDFRIFDLCKTSDGGYAMFGTSIEITEVRDRTVNLWKGLIIKIDADGREEWIRHYEGPPDEADTTWAWTNMVSLGGCVTHDDGYALCGSIQTIYIYDNGDRWITDNGMVFRVDSNGDSVYTYTYGEHDQFRTFCATSDSGFFITDLNRDVLSSDPGSFIDQATALKIDDSQNESWHYDILLDGSGGHDTGDDTSSIGTTVFEIPDNDGYVIAGQKTWYPLDLADPGNAHYNSELFISHFNADGNLDKFKLYGDEFGDTEYMPIEPRAAIVKENGNYLICGYFQLYKQNGYYIFPSKGFVFEIEAGIVGVEDEQTFQLPDQVSLKQNYPNPFNATTSIQFTLNQSDDVALSVYDIMGRKVNTLYSGILPAGTHNLTWNGTDSYGDVVGSGVYFYRLKTSEVTSTKQMLLLK